jgi:hypothetical protein
VYGNTADSLKVLTTKVRYGTVQYTVLLDAAKASRFKIKLRNSWESTLIVLYTSTGRVTDPHHFNADPGSLFGSGSCSSSK